MIGFSGPRNRPRRATSTRNGDETVNIVNKLSDVIAYVLQRIVALVIFAMFVLNLVQIVARYVAQYSIIWLNDVIILSLLWMCCLGIPWLWLTRKHLVMDALDKYLPPKGLAYLQVFNSVLAAVFAVLLTISALSAYEINYGMIASAAGFDESIRYIPFIVSGVLWVICSILDLIRAIWEVKHFGD